MTGIVKVLLVPSGCLLASVAIALTGSCALTGGGMKPGTPLASSASMASSFLSRPYKSGKGTVYVRKREGDVVMVERGEGGKKERSQAR